MRGRVRLVEGFSKCLKYEGLQIAPFVSCPSRLGKVEHENINETVQH